MRKVDTWMPLYVADYLADTMRLTCEQHGAYLLLIMDYWRNGPPPDDDVVLAQITRCTSDQWARIKPVILNHFDIVDGALRHGRIEKELVSAKEKALAAGAKAKAAADARWSASRNALSMPDAVLVGKHDECPSPSPSPNTKTSSSSAGADLPCPFDEIVSLYHECMPLNPRCKALSEARKASIRGRWKECSHGIGTLFGYSTKDQGIEKWREFFTVCNESEFLTGKTQGVGGRKPFIADLEWLMKQANFLKVIENKYHRSAA
jgi:uncharacterized protein YdaU (DUF1376 family)